ncbi:hypothetical protein P9112_004637 [Eukaryota sp. TZLM1-RC]
MSLVTPPVRTSSIINIPPKGHNGPKETSTPFGLNVPKLSSLADDSSDEEAPSPQPTVNTTSEKPPPSLSPGSLPSPTLVNKGSVHANSSADLHSSSLSKTHTQGSLIPTTFRSLPKPESNANISVIDFTAAPTDGDSLHQQSKVVELADGAVIVNSDPLTIKLHGFLEHLFSNSISKREFALKEICQIVWLGGFNYQVYVGSTGVLELCVEILSNNIEPFSLKTKSLQLLAIALRNCNYNQSRANENGLLLILSELLTESNKMIRMWACNVMFNLLWNNFDIQTTCRLYTSVLSARLRSVANEDWRVWSHNDAVEILKLMDWRID